MNRPFTRRDDIIDDYHGTKVADPYRWLENPSSEDTLAWVDAQNALMSHYIKAISATFILAADTDDRVVPAHAKKFAATLQAANGGNNPILLRIETKAGHGLGKPTAKVIEERSDVLAFLFERFRM